MSTEDCVENKENMAETNGSGLTDQEKKIIYQMEYYFGDINLAKDKFLQEKIKEDDGYVTFEVLLTFNKLKSITEDVEVIVAAIKKSENNLLEVSEDGKKVRRSPEKPLPENNKERRDDLNNRSIYCKGFPEDCDFDTIKEFLDKHGVVENIYLRRIGKKFKGSIFAVFKTKEQADSFVKAESIKFGETELKRLLRTDYFLSKTEEKRQLKLEKEKAAKEETAKQMNERLENMKDSITHGTILHLEGFADDTSREDVRNFFEDFSKVAWVDFNPGDKKGQVRFAEENQAQVALDKAKEANGGKIELNGGELQGRVLEGEEELSHWKMIFSDRSNRDMNRRKPMKRGRGKFGSFKGKRRGQNNDGAPAAKAAKTE
ncbi:lupus La protein homolog isoform X1 [Patella vulgata]|uniref:lupus La protein homolog isoform X1 n=2 Tax=Patella vulgata TaxID=6465 RepID=UPI00217FC4AA|nr:lupus La protein homolog isoform X1 [Patella vulgata]